MASLPSFWTLIFRTLEFFIIVPVHFKGVPALSQPSPAHCLSIATDPLENLYECIMDKPSISDHAAINAAGEFLL